MLRVDDDDTVVELWVRVFCDQADHGISINVYNEIVLRTHSSGALSASAVRYVRFDFEQCSR